MRRSPVHSNGGAPVSFRPCSPDLMKELHNHNVDIPTAYFHSSRIVQWLFYQRLRQALVFTKYAKKKTRCLDVGCGAGPLFPSLSEGFKETIGLDRDVETAKRVCDQLRIRNIELVRGDLFTTSFPEERFDCIFALDVIEHLENVEEALQRFSRWLALDGILIVCVPTENFLYRMGRRLFGFRRPHDHHDLPDMFRLLRRHFQTVRHKAWPLPVSSFAQFHVYAASRS